jgi:hypothetical protein
MMNLGMLWFDNDTKTDLAARISRAVTYYRGKYGQEPNLCFVNPKTLNGAQPTGVAIEVRTTRSVLPNHFWLGVSSSAG